MKGILGILMAGIMVAAMVAPAMAQPSPFVINGYISDSGNNPCNDPAVRITNMNTIESRDANNNSASNYYNLVLDIDDVSAGDILRFDASGGSESKTVEHTITQTEVDAGGLFDINIILASAVPSTPFMIYGFVTDSSNNPCNDPAVRITNTNTSVSWDAENDSASNYYDLVLATADVSAGDVLRFNASEGSVSKTVEHTVTQTEVDAGGLFDFNITLASGVANVAVTMNNTVFSNVLAGSTNEIPISLTLTNTGTAPANIEAVFTTNDGSSIYGLNGTGTNIIPGNNFKLGPDGSEQTLTSTTTGTLICTLGAGQTLDYNAILIVPPGQTPDDYMGTIQLSW